jgi:hypothetical protein
MIYPSGGAQQLLQFFAAFETRDMATRPATRCKARDYIHFHF